MRPVPAPVVPAQIPEQQHHAAHLWDNNVTHGGWGFELEFYENTRTRIYFEPGYAVEAGDLVVFVPK